MRFALVMAGLLLLACGPEPKAVRTETKKAEKPKPPDESRRFPLANQVETTVVADQLLGKPFMPGGTIARYKKGNVEYEMFVARLQSPTDAAIALIDWKKALTDAQLIPAFGGYSGKDSGKPVFVFTKGAWIAGISGLPFKEADPLARGLAGRID